MKKLKKFFKGIFLLLQRPSLLNLILESDDSSKKEVNAKYGLGKGLPIVDLLDLIPDFNETIEPMAFLDGSSSPLDLALLCGMAKRKPNCNYLEIGNWRGESLANVSRYATTLTGINISDEEMRKMGLAEKYINLHYFFSKHLPNIKVVRENSQKLDFTSLKEQFDLIFVDGDHHYESVRSDTTNAFKVLKDKTSVIIWHDYAYHPERVRWNILLAILDGCPAEKRKHLYYVSNTHCAIYFPETIKSQVMEEFSAPNKYFSLNITTKKIVEG